jgi:hypothetical protein
MNRTGDKQGTELLDVLRLALDQGARPAALAQIGEVHPSVAADIALHVDLWSVRRRAQVLPWIHTAGGEDLSGGAHDLVAELLLSACERR